MARRSRSVLQVLSVLGLVAAAGVLTLPYTFTQPGPASRRAALTGALLGLTGAATGASAAEWGSIMYQGKGYLGGGIKNGVTYGDPGNSWEAVLDPTKTDSARAWQGRYADPNHPGCKREILSAMSGMIVRIVDGEPGCLQGEKLKFYELQTTWPGKPTDKLDIDFSPKGGPKKVTAKYLAEGKFGALLFPDGNKWVRLSPGSTNSNGR